jgi:hypothetical protein
MGLLGETIQLPFQKIMTTYDARTTLIALATEQ